MSKKKLFLASLILSLGALTGCGDDPAPYDPDADPTGGGEITRKDFEYALNYDYQSFVIDYVQQYADGAFVEQAREYHKGGRYGVTAVDDITYDESVGSVSYSFYASTSEDDYAYWPSDNYYVYSGWVSNGYRNADLAMYHAYFSFYYLLDNITVDDVEPIAGLFYVKPESMEKLNSTAFQFYGNPLLGGEDLTTIAFYLDDNTGLFYKIYGSISEGSDDGFEMIFSNINSASYPVNNVPAAPYRNSDTDRNIYTYEEMLGDHFVPDVWPSSVSLSICETVDTEEGYDMVIDLDQSVDIAYALQPDGVNRKEYRWVVSDSEVVDLEYKSNFTAGHKYVTGVKEGTTEVYIEFKKEDGTYIRSNTLKVKVNGVKEIDKTDAVYDLTVLGGDYRDTGEVDLETSEHIKDKDYTDILFHNGASLVPEAPYQVEGHNIHLLDASNTESFGETGKVIYASPSSQEYMNSEVGFNSYLLFDFGDQEVVSLDFYYSLQRSNQKGASDALSEAYISTSIDGNTWSDPIDMKAEMRAEFDKMNLDYDANLKIMSRTFEKARQVKLFFKASMVGKNFNICMNSFVFKHDSTCHDHDASGEVVDVESIAISSTATSVKVGKTLSFSVSSILPLNATDKSVSWHVDDAEYASIDESGVLTASKEGTVKVYALSSNNVKSNEIEITIIGQEYLPTKWVGVKYLTNNVVENLKYYSIELLFTSTTEATLIVTPSGEASEVISFTYDTYDSTHIAPHTFVGANNESLHVKLSDYDDSTCEVFLSGSIISLGNTHTNIGEKFTKYVESTSIIAKNAGTPLASTFELIEGKTMSIVTTVNPSSAYHNVATATSSETSVATIANEVVDEDPVDNVFTLTAVAPGTSTLTFSNGEVEATYTVTVIAAVGVSSLSLTASKSSIEVDEQLQLNLVINPSNANNYKLSYTMDNSTYASFNSNTLVLTGKKVGSVTVTVTDSVSGQSSSLTIGVTEATYIIHPSYVGTWFGEDLAGSEFSFIINEDGTATLVSDAAGINLSFELDSSKSTTTTYYFDCTSGDLTICIYGTGEEKSIDAEGDDTLIDGLYLTYGTSYVTKE